MIKADELGILAYRELKKLILNGTLAPGEKIVQEKIASKFGISRTPLRVALNMLEAEHLIVPKSKSGYQVKVIEDTEILEIFDCRIALEATAAGLLAKRITPKEVKKLESFFTPLEEESFSGNYKKADTQFHNYIVEKCGNGFLHKLFQQGNLITYIERIGLIRPPQETYQEHQDIIQAIVSGNAEEAEKAMRTHLIRSKTIVEENIKNEQKPVAIKH